MSSLKILRSKASVMLSAAKHLRTGSVKDLFVDSLAYGLRITILLTTLLVIRNAFVFAEEPKVELQKVEGRTEATVTSTAPAKATLNVRWFKKPFVWGEQALVGTARTTSGAVGLIADKTVEGTETITGFLFSRFFNTLDYKNWGKKQNNQP